MRKLTAFILTVFVMLAGKAFAVPIDELVGPENGQELRTTGSVKLFQLKDPKIGLAPSGEIGQDVRKLIEAFDPSITVEALYLYKKPAGAAIGTWSSGERTALYNVMRSISTLAGIEYYSASRKRMRVFYETSAVVDGPEGSVALPDPLVQVPPAQSTIYAVQKDLSFGENTYQYDYMTGGPWLSFVQKNLTTMKYGIIPVLGKGKLRTIVYVVDAEDALLFYAVSAARALSVPGLEGKIRDSFSNRADAIYGWFTAHATDALNSVKKEEATDTPSS